MSKPRLEDCRHPVDSGTGTVRFSYLHVPYGLRFLKDSAEKYMRTGAIDRTVNSQEERRTTYILDLSWAKGCPGDPRLSRLAQCGLTDSCTRPWRSAVIHQSDGPDSPPSRYRYLSERVSYYISFALRFILDKSMIQGSTPTFFRVAFFSEKKNKNRPRLMTVNMFRRAEKILISPGNHTRGNTDSVLQGQKPWGKPGFK